MASLTVDDLVTVYKAAYDARVEWESFGLNLNVSPRDLRAIRVQYLTSEGVDACLRAVLEIWLRRSAKPTWRELVNALRTETVGLLQLAVEIEAQHCPNEDHHAKVKSQQPHNLIPSCEDEVQPLSTQLHETATLQLMPGWPLGKVNSDDLLHVFEQGDSRTDAVLELLKLTESPVQTITDSDGKTLMHLACRHNYMHWFKVAKTLVEIYSCNPSAADCDGNTPLHDACSYNNEELAKYLLTFQSCHPNIKNLKGETALHIAITKGSLDIVRTLLASGRVNATLYDPLQPVTVDGDPLRVRKEIKMMLDHFNRNVEKYNSPRPFSLLTCCVLIALLEDLLLHNTTSCTLQEIITVSRREGTPLPYDNVKDMCSILSHIRHLFNITEHASPTDTVVEKYPPGYTTYDETTVNDYAVRDLITSLLTSSEPDVDVNCQIVEMEILQTAQQADKQVCVSSLCALENQQIPVNAALSDSRTAPPASIGLLDTNDDAIPTNDTVCAQSLDLPHEQASPVVEDHNQLQMEDDSTSNKSMTCVGNCFEWLYSPNILRAVVVIGIVSAVISCSFLIPLLIDYGSVTGSVFVSRNDLILVRSEGFDPYYVDKVLLAIAKHDRDLHKINLYLNTSSCSNLETDRSHVNRLHEVKLSDEHTVIDSNYLLPGSALTYELMLNVITTENCSAMVYIFDDVTTHLQFLNTSSVLGAIDTICLENNAANFTIITSKASYYFVDFRLRSYNFDSNSDVHVSITVFGQMSSNKISQSPTCQMSADNPYCSILRKTGIVTNKGNNFCILAQVANDKHTTSYLQIDYSTSQAIVQNVEKLTFTIMCAIFAVPFALFIYFGFCTKFYFHL